MNKFLKYKFRTLLFGILSALISFAASAADKKFNVLFIQSQGVENPWSQNMVDVLTEELKSKNISVNVTTEYLNASLWNDDDKASVMRNFLRRAFQNKVDLIVTEGDEAFNTLINCGNENVKDIPVIFYGVEFPDQEIINNLPKVVGLTSERNYQNLLQEAIRTFPNRKELLFVHSGDTISRRSVEEIRKAWDKINAKYPGYRFNDFNTDERELESLITLVSDPDNVRRYIIMVPKRTSVFSLKPQAPIFSCDASDSDVLAYYDVDPVESARWAGQQASKILAGGDLQSIGIYNGDPKFYYSYNELKDYGANIKDVESRSGVVVRYDFFSRYKEQVLIGGTVFVLILVVLMFVVIFNSVRQRRRRRMVERDLEVSKHLVRQRDEYDSILSSISDSLIMVDENMRIKVVNMSFLSMLGLPADSESSKLLEGKVANEIVHIFVNNTEVLDSLLASAMKGEDTVIIPENAFMYHKISNMYFPVKGEIVPFIQDNKISGAVLVCRNISEEENQRQMLNMAAEVTNIFPWQFDVAKNHLIFNSGIYSQLGLETVEYMTRSNFMRFLHPDDVTMMVDYLDAIREGSTPKEGIRVRIKMANGKYIWWHFSVAPVNSMNPSGTNSVIIGIVQNVQSSKEYEEQLKEARDEALKSDKLKSAFLANMSHEIRTPLNAIVGFSNLLAVSDDPAKKQQFVGVIEKNNELLMQLINDVLDLAKVDSGTLEFNYDKIDVNELIRTAEDTVRLRIKRGVVLNYYLGAQQCYIISDANRLLQVITNLLTNASKFTLRGSITFGYDVKGNELEFFVEDTGKGIDKDKLDAVFQRFYKADSFAQGTGLGLSICKSIIETLKGRIGVTSDGPGTGSRFWFTIPYDPEIGPDEPLQPVEEQPVQHGFPGWDIDVVPAQPAQQTATPSQAQPQRPITPEIPQQPRQAAPRPQQPSADMTSAPAETPAPVAGEIASQPTPASAPEQPAPAPTQPMPPTNVATGSEAQPAVTEPAPAAPKRVPRTRKTVPPAAGETVSTAAPAAPSPVEGSQVPPAAGTAPIPGAAPARPRPRRANAPQQAVPGQPAQPVQPVQPAQPVQSAQVPPAAAAPAPAPAPAAAPAPEPAARKKLILVAEDNPSNYILFENILNAQYDVVHAWNGEEAVTLYKENHPDLIIMDINMPVKDGYGATADIRKMSATVPIIAVTAYAFASDRDRILRSGFNGYISKPINPNRLVQEIRNSIE